MSTTHPIAKLIPLPKVADLPWLPYQPSKATLYRWASPAGISGCRLRTVRGGRGLCCTETDVLEFFEALAAPRIGASPSQPSGSKVKASALEKAASPTDAELDREGIH